MADITLTDEGGPALLDEAGGELLTEDDASIPAGLLVSVDYRGGFAVPYQLDGQP